MKIGIVAPSPVPFVVGGAEKLWWGLARAINEHTHHQAEIVKLPTAESTLWQLVDHYRRFSELDLDHFDLVISGKYPAWMVKHRHHVCYMLHRLRGLYDCYSLVAPGSTPYAHPEADSVLDFLTRHHGRREALPELFALLERLHGMPDLPPEVLSFPGPLSRKIIHFLDGIGLSPWSCRHFAAISQTVAAREAYFPPGVRVRVVYPAPNLEGFRCGGDQYLFTTSRLDRLKRIDLLIQAMRQVRENIELWIAGSGPAEEQLRRLAAGDERIRFLGFVSDEEILALYADALAVPFVPYQEDLGLVTIEAMKSGKPVLTTLDSGGPLEFVVDGETGFVVPPDPAALAERIEYLCQHRAAARAMGAAARKRVSGIHWENTVGQLLPCLSGGGPRGARGRRRKLVVATTFPVHLPQGGGQLRVFNLYRRLATRADIDLVTLGAPGRGGERLLAPGLREVRVPKSPAHEAQEAQLSQAVSWIPVTDIAMSLLFEQTPAYIEALAAASLGAEAIIACHPYVLPAIKRATNETVWYEAQDVELELKETTLPDTPEGRRLLAVTRDVELRCCTEAEHILVCSGRDGSVLSELYQFDRKKLIEVPNGVDWAAVRYLPPAARRARKRELGIDDRFVALFVGSWHGPNLDAMRALLKIAQAQPAVHFLVLGGASLAFKDEPCPPNVGLMGIVDETTKTAALQIADVALNPMRYGSGTNLKILEYCAAGIPVLSTPHGVRGLKLVNGIHLQVAAIEEFPQAIEQLCNDPERASRLAERSRQLVACHYSWGIIADRLWDRIC